MLKREATCMISICLVLMFLPAGPAKGETGVARDRILIGMSTVLTGPAMFLGTSFWMGSEAYLKSVNEKGGVHGRNIKLVVYDDGYEPDRAVVNTKKMIAEDKVFCLFGNVGTPTAVAIKPILENERVPLVAPFTGAEALRRPLSRYLIHYRASYNQETEAFVQGMVDVLGYKKIAVFYQNDPYGLAVLNGTKAALKKRGLKPVGTGTYTRNLEDVLDAVDQIMSDKPDAVVMGGTYSACAKFIIAWKRRSILGKKGLNPVFMNVSFVGPDRLAALLDQYGHEVVVTQVVPPFFSSETSYPAVAEYLSLMDAYFPKEKPTFVGFEGFLASKLLVEMLRKTGKDLTRESFINTVEGTRDLDIQAGNIITFGPDNHQGSQMVYPTVIKNGKFQMITDWASIRQPFKENRATSSMPGMETMVQ